MARKQQQNEGGTKVRVLRDCDYGKADDVAEVSADLLDGAVASGEVDPHPDAVAYAQTLEQNQPKA